MYYFFQCEHKCIFNSKNKQAKVSPSSFIADKEKINFGLNPPKIFENTNLTKLDNVLQTELHMLPCQWHTGEK